MATLGELATASSIRDWKLVGRDAVVKVVSTEESGRVFREMAAGGYVTQARFLAGKNAFQIERDLGLRPESLRKGAFVFYFARLPTPREVEQKYTADFPDGKAWTPEMHRDFDLARDLYRTNPFEIRVEYYPPGSARVRQWRLTQKVPISGKALQVTPSTTLNIF